MADARNVNIIRQVYKTVGSLLSPERFYAVQYDAERKQLDFPLVIVHGQEISPWQARNLQKELLLDQVLSKGEMLLLSNGLARYLAEHRLRYWPQSEVTSADWFALPQQEREGQKLVKPKFGLPYQEATRSKERTPVVRSWLAVPLVFGPRVTGALVIENWRASEGIDEDVQRIMGTVARQAAMALENARLERRLKRKINSLSVLHTISQEIAHSFRQDESDLINLFYEKLDSLPMNTENMYFMFCQPETGRITFEAMLIPEKKDFGPLQSGHYHRRLAERLIADKKALLLSRPQEIKKYTSLRGTTALTLLDFASWMGAPLVAGEKALGVIAVFHANEYKYSDDDLEVLEILAGQVAAASQNKNLYALWEKQQEIARAAERLALMNDMAAEFVHRMNNVAGTIPIWTGMARDILDENEETQAELIYYLDQIERDSQQIIEAAQEIDITTKPREAELVDINKLIDVAVERAISAVPGESSRFEVNKILSGSLPRINLERNKMLATLRSIIKNGLEAMAQGGKLTLVSKMSEDGQMLEVLVTDTGEGITEVEQQRIFDLFYSTKKQRQGLGFGLWRDKSYLNQLGGDILVRSVLGQGSTFTLRIPLTPIYVNLTKEENNDVSRS